MQKSLTRLASKSNESYKGKKRGDASRWQSPLNARPLFYAVLTYVHNECIDKCEFFYIASVNLVNQDPVHLVFFPLLFLFLLFILFRLPSGAS